MRDTNVTVNVSDGGSNAILQAIAPVLGLFALFLFVVILLLFIGTVSWLVGEGANALEGALIFLSKL